MAISKTKIAAVAAALSVFASTSVVSAFADSAPVEGDSAAETSSVVVEADSAAEETSEADSAAEETSEADSAAEETSAADSVADETSEADSVADETSSAADSVADDTSSVVESTWADYTADEYAGQALLTATADAPDADGNVVVHYALSGDTKGLAGFALKVEYDDTAFEVGSVAGISITGIVPGSNTTESPYSLNWADPFNPAKDGELFTITFKAKAALTPGATYTFAAHLDSRGNVADADENDYVIGLLPATITVAGGDTSKADDSSKPAADSSSKADTSSTAPTASSSTAPANSSSSKAATSSTTTSTKTTTSTTTKPATTQNANPNTGVAASGAAVLLGLAAVVVAKKRK